MSDTLTSLRDSLIIDTWREAHGFSDDIEKANRVLHNSLATDGERQSAFGLWLYGHEGQPCVFGKLAAKQKKMHLCFVTHEDLGKSDQHIRDKVEAARRLWKRRAFNAIPEHGLMIIVCDRTVACSLPDENLRRFSVHLQNLVGWEERPGDRGNTIVDEWLYLKNPTTGEIVKYTFSVDFFASAGDKRWWHDHRVPGGLAFTANSLGHMAQYRQWFENEDQKLAWSLRLAMRTIDSAVKSHPFCPATFLLDLKEGAAAKAVNWREPPSLPLAQAHKNKDHSSYGGYLHTDHAIRDEFFRQEECPAHHHSPYDMDFTYIFDTAAPDNFEFMVGEPATEEQVLAELGSLDTPQLVMASEEAVQARPREITTSIEQALDELRQNAMSDEELEELMR